MRKSAQLGALAFSMALKYSSLELLAVARRSQVWIFMALCEAFTNSLRSVVRRGVHQGFDLGKGRERGVWVSIVEERVERAEENQRLGCFGKGLSGGGGGFATPCGLSPGWASRCHPILA